MLMEHLELYYCHMLRLSIFPLVPVWKGIWQVSVTWDSIYSVYINLIDVGHLYFAVFIGLHIQLEFQDQRLLS